MLEQEGIIADLGLKDRELKNFLFVIEQVPTISTSQTAIFHATILRNRSDESFCGQCSKYSTGGFTANLICANHDLQGYRALPYHNSAHAADVTQALYYLLKLPEFQQHVDEENRQFEMLAW